MTHDPSLVIEARWRGVDGATLVRVVDANGRDVPGPRVALVGHTHGNEIVGGAALRRFHAQMDGRLRAGSVLLLLNNLEAMALNLRHTPAGRDMNRLWDRASLQRIAASPVEALCYEERRVAEVAPLLRTSDVLLDLHSTSRPSRPHLVFRDDLRHAELAGKLGVRLMVTGIHEGAILGGGVCPDLDLAPGERGARIGFTLEAGQHTNPENVEHAWGVVVRLLVALGMWDEAVAPVAPDFEVYEVIERFVQAPEGAAPYTFVDEVGGAEAQRRGPSRRLESFEPVEADEVLLRRGASEVVRAEAPFTMLMPAPTAGPGEDLFYFCQRRHAALALRPQSDDAARLEAMAVERFLDLLTDDEGQRGATSVSFHARRTLDRCAELIGRVVRLPVGHPHRRLTVVGRGDDAVDETEARTGKRYQQAMARALAAGVPVDRVQLLRGASGAWLRQLALPEGGHAPRTFVSVRHPHTVSLLLAGDPDRAFAEGDFHHVAVALLVEAATVDPVDGEVRVRVNRAGLFGARPELVRVAMALVRSLQAEHGHLVADGALGPVAELAAWMDTDGGLRPATPPQLAALRRVVLQLQERTWRQSLRHEVTRPVQLASAAELGAWLARVMATTGILDAHALLRLVVRPEGDGWRVDPALLVSDAPRAEVSAPPSPHDVPDQALDATDVDRDTLERWMGWKRFVREVQSVPGSRGRDLDLAFDGGSIRTTLCGWLDDARRLGAEEPGRWQVVIAGEGLSPRRPGEELARLFDAHAAVVRDPNVRYQRIQHAQGTHLGWMKALVDDVARRPAHGEPVSVCWETEHGGTVNVMLLCRRMDPPALTPWSLEGWEVVRCAVVVREADTTGEHDDAVALFAAPDRRGGVNHELLHFGRAYCEGLLRQAGRRIAGRPGPAIRVALDSAVVELVSRWVSHVRDDRDELTSLSAGERGREVARRLGLQDAWLADALASAVVGDGTATDAARRIWSEARAWAGATA